MKSLLVVLALAMSSQAFAEKFVFAGSDTLAGAITDAITNAGLEDQIQYIGGGSGNGEKGLVAGDQAIAPMSREMKDEVKQLLSGKSISVTAHVVALDGLSIFVKADNPIASLDLPTVTRIFTCEFTRWEQIPNSGKTGVINVYRRNDVSGTTDAFKHFTGIKAFGACVTVVDETADIADVTSRDPQALGYAGLSGKTADNRSVAMARKAGDTPVLPTTATIRDFSYPMARNLYVYELSGAVSPNAAEANLMSYITDRSFMDPIVQAHDFITVD
jgi:phosphate transport system substrate-binding protein